MEVIVEVMPKVGILDPAGVAVRNALHQLGFVEVSTAKVGKRVLLEMDTDDADEARRRAEEMGSKLLANENVESFRVVLPEGVDS